MVQTMYDAETGICDVFNAGDCDFFWYKNVYEVADTTLYILFLPDVGLVGNAPRAIRQYAQAKHTKVVLDFSIESPLMWPIHVSTTKKFSRLVRDSGTEIKPFFEVIHNIVRDSGVHYTLFEVYTANPFISELYDVWCSNNGVVDKVTVGYRELWAANTLKDSYLMRHAMQYDPSEIKHRYYTCLNNRPRSHRVQLIQELYRNGTLDQGIVTFVFDGATKRKMKKKYPEIADMIPKFLEHDLSMFSLSEHIPGLDQYYTAFQSSYYDIITETQVGVDYNHKVFKMCFPEHHWRNCFFTEKIWRSILMFKPFMLLGSYRQLENMRQLGFRTFHGILFDESYDLIEDPESRVQAIADENRRIIDTYTLPELQSIIAGDDVQTVIRHNRDRVIQFAKEYSFDLTQSCVRSLSNITNPNLPGFQGFTV
jgi:hypothetical protein